MQRARVRVAATVTLGVALALALVAACSIGDLDLNGRACPCAEGYVCDLSTNRCVTGLPDAAAAVILPDAADAAAIPSLVTVSGLGATWVAPAMIRWDWTLTGAAADFRAYEVVTGPTADAIDKRVGVDVITSIVRPELGGFDLRGRLTSGAVAMWTLTEVRTPALKQFMQVKVTDVKGRSSLTAIASATSAAKTTAQLVIFDGTASKTSVPAAEYLFRTPGGGEPNYFFQADCAGAKTCAKRADLVSLALDLSPPAAPFTAAAFERAVLEVQLEGNVAVTSFETIMALEPGDGSCNQGISLCRFRFTGWTERTSGRTKLQVPLKELRNDAGPLTFAILQSKGFLLDTFTLSSPSWKNNATVLLYDARIRW